MAVSLLSSKPRGKVEVGSRLPQYDFNDDIIPDGIAYWVNVVRHELGTGLDGP